MSTIGKLAVRRVHTGEFKVDQQQRLAQQAAQKLNSQADMLNAMLNRGYGALAVDTTLATSASYATLATATITTVLASGYLLITATASGVQLTNAAVDQFQITVDGVVIKGCYQSSAINGGFSVALVVRVAVTRGLHTVLWQAKCTSSSLRVNAATVNDEHAHVLVQEAA